MRIMTGFLSKWISFLIVVMILQVYTYAKPCKIQHFAYEQFFECQLWFFLYLLIQILKDFFFPLPFSPFKAPPPTITTLVPMSWSSFPLCSILPPPNLPFPQLSSCSLPLFFFSVTYIYPLLNIDQKTFRILLKQNAVNKEFWFIRYTVFFGP